MKVIHARNVNGAYAIAHGVFSDLNQVTGYPSRNGPMVEVNQPVTTVYDHPQERVLFDADRDANPFLHFFESLWMLDGRDDVQFLLQFTKQFAEYSDDGFTLNGAYGNRWRFNFGFDQIGAAVEELRDNPMSRRVVTQMWDGYTDGGAESKDLPCNTAIFWRLRGGVLDMTVTNRSNDAIWGAYGANAVHFSMLHEYVAGSVGVEMGVYRQVSNSLHIYPELDVTQRFLDTDHMNPRGNDRYQDDVTANVNMFDGGIEAYEFDEDLGKFFMSYQSGIHAAYDTPFFCYTVDPMWRAFMAFKEHDYDAAMNYAKHIEANDWRVGCVEWLERRALRRAAEEAN